MGGMVLLFIFGWAEWYKHYSFDWIRTVSKSYRTRATHYKKNLEHIFKIGFLPHICDILRINLKNVLLKYSSGLARGQPLRLTTFFGFWTRLFWRLVPLKPEICSKCGSFGNFRMSSFNFCSVSGDWINWTCLGAI